MNPGDMVRITAAFTNAAGAAADPTAVSLRIRPQGGSETVLVYGTDVALVKDSTGNYHADYTVPSIAPHHGLTIRYRWIGTGAVTTAEEGSFVVSSEYV